MGFRSSGAWTAIAPDGTIYCSDPFRLYALAPDGALKWLVQDAGGERPISVSADGTIYTATGDLSRFVEAGKNCLQARIRYHSANPRQQFSSNTDQFIWTIGQ